MRVIDLTLGQPAVDPAAGVVDAVRAHVEGGRAYRYPPRGGPARLRRALAAKLRAVNGIDVADRDVVVSCGASQALLAVLATTCDRGDAFLAPAPGFPHYRLLAELLGLELRPYGVGPTGCDLDGLAAAAAAAPHARALLWNSPHNPLGWVAGQAEHARVLELAAERGLAVVSDEVYEALVYDGEHLSPAALAGATPVYSIFSASKTLGIAGWRLGYVAGPPGSGEALERVVWATTMGAPTVAAAAVLASLRGYEAHVRSLRACLRRRRDLVLRRLAGLGLPAPVPAAGCFAWVEVPGGSGAAAALADDWRRRCAVLVTPGSAFGASGEGCVRVSFGAPEADLEEAFDRLAGPQRAHG